MSSRNIIYTLLLSAFTVVPACEVSASALSPTIFLSATASAAPKKSTRKKTTSKKRTTSKKTTKKKTTAKKKSTTANRWSNASAPAPEQPSNDSLTLAVNSALLKAVPENINPGGLRVNSVRTDGKARVAKVSLNENFTYLPVTQELISSLSKEVRASLPDSVADFTVTLNVGQRPLAYYITKVDKLPAAARQNPPFVVEKEPYVDPKKGMDGDIVALWHSHGRYYRNGSWQWQRPVLFETIEDIFTMGYILPYTVPMLENAGAYVLLPRERDVNRNEVIVDNDTNDGGELYSQPYYKEKTGQRRWETGEFDGFIYDLKDFRDTENPFEVGTYRQTTTVRSGEPSVAAWYADIPEDGEYAVYVSYKTLPNSTEDARYTVTYSGGQREYRVNQTMGGSTWVYLGTFPFEKGYSDTEPVVTLTNISDSEGKTVTADAVKIGGGMGNISRSPKRADVYYDPSTPVNDLASAKTPPAGDDDDEEEDEDVTEEEGAGSVDGEAAAPQETSAPAAQKGAAPVFRTSGLPRYLEGARYWLHWAGFPESVYSPYHGTDDYKDDYTSRGHWVNYLAGGSRVLPGQKGLNIPVDVSMALHSDAGKKSDDSFVGTLGIYFTNNGDSYTDGTPRINSRMLTDMLMRQITGDIRQTYEPNWTRRSMWDKSYVEARVPEVPTALIELLSHQNFADMRYGLDPGFRFTVGRAIYKALARFMSERKDRDLVIQPLPVNSFAIQPKGKGGFRLSWQPTPDPLEPTADAKSYIIFERRQGELGFHKIGETHSTHFDVHVTDHLIHSFKVVASNEGGLSFPSEILALRMGEDKATPVLIVNGFDRVAGPENFSADGNAGFRSEDDFGVPYIRDISFAGHQREFRRSAGESFGRSDTQQVSTVIAGNTFDFAAMHGEAVADAGFGFTSTSAKAVEDGTVKLADYKAVDLILGKQKSTVTGRGKSGVRYATFPPELQKALEAYADKGGDIIMSGQYIVSDLFGQHGSEADRDFARSFLGVEPDTLATRSRSGKAVSLAGADKALTAANYSYSNTLNEKRYIVERPDALTAAPGADAYPFLELGDTGAKTGFIIRDGRSNRAVLSLPIEAITDPGARSRLMGQLLKAVMK